MKKVDAIRLFVFLFFLCGSFAHGQPVEIRILHINDFHGFAESYQPIGSDEPLGGIAYLAHRANELRKEKPTLLLCAGDMIQGHHWANLFQGESVIELMNQMKFDAMVLGNHEFDFGQEVLQKRISEAMFPMLGANVKGLNGLKPFIVREVKGLKIGIIGIVTEETPISTHPQNVEGLQFLSSMEVVGEYISDLKNRVDFIVVLSHIGYSNDRRLAENIQGINLIVGGHSHTKLNRPVMIGETILVQAWEHGKALGVLDLALEHGKIAKYEGYLEEIRPKGQKDQAVSALVEKFKEKVSTLLNEEVGEAEEDLDGENVRKRETNFGDLLADILRQASGSDIALINGGGIRASIRKGRIKLKDVYAALPFNNYIVTIKLRGKQIWDALEHGVSNVENEDGRFPQVSGLTFKYSLSEKKGERVKEISIFGRPIDLDKEYSVATHDFLAAGGDGYQMFRRGLESSKEVPNVGGILKGGKVVTSHTGKWLRDIVVEYLREKKRVAPRVEDRIREIRS
ncbi:MAG: 5'-nucleotidase C-terminal domain-containing protein [Syntrophaceae bacterium]|nr:5'-nucleotidase C-terminal domain-containing protein [Syntrophaceae bacterium]